MPIRLSDIATLHVLTCQCGHLACAGCCWCWPLRSSLQDDIDSHVDLASHLNAYDFEIGDPTTDDVAPEYSGSDVITVQGSGSGATPTSTEAPRVPAFLLGQTNISETQDPFVQMTSTWSNIS